MLVFLANFKRIVALRLQGFDLIDGVTKDEDIVFPDLFSNLNVRAVECADGQRAVQCQFHVAGAGSFFTSGRNLLGNISRRDHQFSHGHAVIRNKHHFDAVTHQRIVIHFFRDFVDGIDDVFRQVITRCRFRAEQEHTRHHVHFRVITQLTVQRQNVQQIQMLAFVFMQTFDLYVENGIRVEGQPHHLFHVMRQFDFVLTLNGLITLTEFFIIRRTFQPFQRVQVIHPFGFQGVINQR
ncbi:hypothetical protein SRABI106_04689 [Rahnella aquatilis]|nr:hypothetical protein SRABI106_04689 [Rahnella aquatilis]